VVDVNSAFNNTKIDYKILLLILVGLILFQVYLQTSEPSALLTTSTLVISFIGSTLAGIASLFVANKHGRSKMGYSFYSLAIAFFSIAVGEIFFSYFSYVGIDAFPSIADLFYFLLYPFQMIHLIVNINFYQNQCTLKSKIGMIVLASLIILAYAFFAFECIGELNIDFFYGLIFVSGAACITSVGLYGALVVRKIPLGRSWFLLVTAIVLGTVADVWYYVTELLEMYTLDHIVNLCWYAGYFISIYALYKHYKIM